MRRGRAQCANAPDQKISKTKIASGPKKLGVPANYRTIIAISLSSIVTEIGTAKGAATAAKAQVRTVFNGIARVIASGLSLIHHAKAKRTSTQPAPQATG